MSFRARAVFSFAAILLFAAIVRIPKLELRPVHGDEAVHGIKFGALLERGEYRYDPHQYHGPALYYFSLPAAWLSGAHTIREVSEGELRLVPVAFSLLLIAGLALFWESLGRDIVLVAAGLLTLSPAINFYSRYYIHEMLFVSFAFLLIACGHRYARSGAARWIVCAGVAAGLLPATKETFVIPMFALFLALAFLLVPEERRGWKAFKCIRRRHLALGILAALATTMLFFSSFLTHPAGIRDALFAVPAYLERGGSPELHRHAWFYYLQLLILPNSEALPFWSEAAVVLFAGIGFVLVLRKSQYLHELDWPLARFLAVWTLAMFLIYSLIPYKTPWNMLIFYTGFLMLAAIGGIGLWRMLHDRRLRGLYAAIGILVAGHLGWQSYRANFVQYDDPQNPFVYAHPTRDVFAMLHRIRAVAGASTQERRLHIEFICKNSDYWPFPWYLRDFERIGWWDHVDFSAPAAPVIIISPEFESDLIHKLYELPRPGERNLYVPLFDRDMALRPQVLLRGYVRKELWDAYAHASRAEEMQMDEAK